MPLSRMRKTLLELGTANGLLYLLGRALQRMTGGRAFIVRYHFVAQPVPSAPTQHTRPSVSARVRQIMANDAIVEAFPRPAAVIKQRFQNGNICFVAENNGRFAGFLWLARDAYEEDEIRCRYELSQAATCAWDFDVYVAPEYRIGRTFARLWDAANEHLSQAGVHWSLSRISAFNRASISAHRRLGIRKLCSATFLTLGPLQISFLPGQMRIHLRSRPVIRLSAPPPGTPGFPNAA